MSKSDKQHRNIVHENVIRIGAGFAAKEHPHVVETLSMLGPHLGGWGSRGVLGAGVRRRARHREMVAVQSTWDSEGGATRETESLPRGVECPPPRGPWWLTHVRWASVL
jgi:hypothetical protein